MEKKPGIIPIHQRLISQTENEITTEYTYRTSGSKKEKTMTMTYIGPKTEEERKKGELQLQRTYDMLFEEVLKSDEWKQYKAKQKKRTK